MGLQRHMDVHVSLPCEQPECARPAERGFDMCSLHMANAEDAEDEREQAEEVQTWLKGVGLQPQYGHVALKEGWTMALLAGLGDPKHQDVQRRPSRPTFTAQRRPSAVPTLRCLQRRPPPEHRLCATAGVLRARH